MRSNYDFPIFIIAIFYRNNAKFGEIFSLLSLLAFSPFQESAYVLPILMPILERLVSHSSLI